MGNFIELCLTINIVDRFLAINLVSRRELQLVGISAMLMTSKYEEIWPPEVNDFVCLSDRAYSHEQILIMEKTIMGMLEWTLTVFHSGAENGKLKVVYKKYFNPQKGVVATLPPAKNLLLPAAVGSLQI
ncbi:amino-terminal domain cyclin [Medicago truncatula]|uniref:B-like cyclin n=1 Tax=Medicago truncatula TaxID=3880 RepID=G7JWS3_MEDTR|nr:amino-terminal domain cyclin [Medicago truncatula]